jgi:hypothetical protein
MSLDRRPRHKRAEAATQRPCRHRNANSRTALQRSGDLAFLAKWRMHGLSLDALHEKLNQSLGGARKLSRAQVGFDLKAVDGAWREERAHDIAHLRDMELAKLDVLERELWEAWDKTKEPLERRHLQIVKSGRAGGGNRKTTKLVTTDERHGDVAIMAQILRVIEIRARILGIAGPQKVEQSRPEGAGLVSAPIVRVIIAPVNAERMDG